MWDEAHWTLLQEAADRPHVQCRLYGNLFGRPGAVDWNGSERHRRCAELATAGLLSSAGMTGNREHPGGQWSRWTITDDGLKALAKNKADRRTDDDAGKARSPPGDRRS